MRVQRILRPKRIDYAWIVCVVCLLLHFCTAGMTTIGFSLHGPYLRDQLGLSNTQVSMVPTIVSLAAMVSLPAASYFYKKFSLRVGTTLSCLLLAISYAGFSVSSSPWPFYLLGILFGVARSLGTMIPITFLLRNWFEHRRSTSTAIALCGSGICSIIMPPVVTGLIERLGLSGTFLLEGALMKDFWAGSDINYMLASNCFGDYYTRTGLDNAQRELVTFCLLAAQGDCAPQLASHTNANFMQGNDQAFLLRVVSQLIPFLGFPRCLNAIAVINQVTGQH